VEFDRYTLVFLVRAADAPDLPEEELDAIQERHIAYNHELQRSGEMACAGPFDDRPDESWRGMCLYVTDIGDTRALAAQDPAVQAGRLEPRILTWLVPKGRLALGPAPR
jgi:uncharacterized protein YciI